MFKITDKSIIGADEMILNMGPQHPSTHGVLRLKIITDGEILAQPSSVLSLINDEPTVLRIGKGDVTRMNKKIY